MTDEIPEEIVERAANSPMMDVVFSWVRRSGPDPTKEEVARSLLAAAMSPPTRECEECSGDGAVADASDIENFSRCPSPSCSNGRVPDPEAPRLALVRQVGGAWFSPTEGIVRNIEKHDALAEAFGFPRASWQPVFIALDTDRGASK